MTGPPTEGLRSGSEEEASLAAPATGRVRGLVGLLGGALLAPVITTAVRTAGTSRPVLARKTTAGGPAPRRQAVQKTASRVCPTQDGPKLSAKVSKTSNVCEEHHQLVGVVPKGPQEVKQWP